MNAVPSAYAEELPADRELPAGADRDDLGPGATSCVRGTRCWIRPRQLRYGYDTVAERFRCSSRQAGVGSTATTTGHGFFI
jgi:hypothetical protein